MQCGEKINADLKSYVVWAHTPDEVKIVNKSLFLLKNRFRKDNQSNWVLVPFPQHSLVREKNQISASNSGACIHVAKIIIQKKTRKSHAYNGVNDTRLQNSGRVQQ
jgi:hypothetical protein